MLIVQDKQIHILYTRVFKNLQEDAHKRCLSLLPNSLKDKHSRFKRLQDRVANLCGKMLLIQGLQRFGLNYSSLENLKYSDYGRPHVSGSLDFNISHSGDYIICGIGNKIRLGVDIEEIKQVDFSDFENVMTEKEWKLIKNANNPLKTFFKYWTIKESIIKADGRGLTIPLNDIIIKDKVAYYEGRWHLKELDVDEKYCVSLASNWESPLISLEYIDLSTILRTPNS